MPSDSSGPPIDVRLLDRLEAHLESYELLGVDLGDGRDVLEFLCRLPMEAVEHLVGPPLSVEDRLRVLALVEHRKGQLDGDELPHDEERRRSDDLQARRKDAVERRRKRGGKR